MYLSKLEIFGFKSFANKTVINFTKGITGIVGPNGCGKTNIVDAIRWALGEQKSSTLRSDKMESVIFNGTRNRKPMGMSEVSLTMVNDNGALPSDYSEITITRRIFRSGESEYLLNRNVCRLKDITNLFMDTGMGTNAYSVIELKMIETILSNKAEERRKMFEEAAGVNKYKLRRKHTIKKLEEVKSDLTRVNDIVAEVEKQVRSLERQAKRADKYNQIQTVLKEKEIDLAERQFYLYTSEIGLLSETNEALTKRKNEIDYEIRNIENELIVFRDNISGIESKLRLKQSEIGQKTEKLHEVQKSISVAEERQKLLKSNSERFATELEELEDDKVNTEQYINDNRESITDYEESVTKVSGEIEALVADVENKKNIFEKVKTTLKEKNEDNLARYKNLSNKENELVNLQKGLHRIKTSMEKLERNIERVTVNIAKTAGFIEQLGKEKKEAKSKLTYNEEIYAKQAKLKEKLEAELASLRENELVEKSALNSLNDKIEFLSELIENLEGFSGAAKELVESESWTSKSKIFLADTGSSKDEFKFALEGALKNYLNNLLIDSTADLKKAAGYLKENDLGKAGFYLLKKQDEKKGLLDIFRSYRKNKKIKKLESEPGFVAWAIELVDTTERWRPYFEQALSGFVIVKDLTSALELSEKYNEFSFTTVDGDIVYSTGIVEAGSLPKPDETIFGRKQMLNDLKKEFPKLESNLEKLREIITEKDDELKGIDLKSLASESKLLENEIVNIEKQVSQLEFEKKKADEDISSSHDEIKEYIEDANGYEEKISILQKEIGERQAEKEQVEAELKDIEEKQKEAELEFNKAKEAVNKRNIDAERLKGQLQNLKNSIGRAENSLESINKGIEKRKTDIDDTRGELYALNSIIEDKQIAYDEVYSERQELVNEEIKIDEELREVKKEASAFEKDLNKLRNERQGTSDKIHNLEIQINEKRYKIETIFNNIKEEYSIEIELKEYEDLDNFNFKSVSQEVHRYKEQLKNIGPVNLLAYSEYEEEKERLEFLLKQRDDLIDSEKDLKNTITEINETAQKLFYDTFLEIRNNFKDIFRTLFDPGDEADLLIEEDVDPLDAKIEITAKPKGKRPTSIELLSGGEKTLTATALLFAIYLVKPSPFCILDEVDAPLDDANVDRFTNLLKEFSNNTQFIIVTHNKRTMEAGENMYGVTMQEEGISKLAAVQFNEDLPVD